ncbi:MAG: DNA alkylation repair protein [Candidatus Saccharimonadales bacterium]
MKIDLEELRKELALLAAGNEEYAEFNKKIVKTEKSVLGVRTPALRKLAKDTAKAVDSAEISLLLDGVNTEIYEEILLAGLVINYAKLSDGEKLELTKKFLKLADNWAHIDMFAEKQRRKYDRELWWDYSLLCLKSDAEFVVRYGVINLMSNYLDDEYLDRTLIEVRAVKHDGYYVKMGLAWLYATAAVYDFERVMSELADNPIDPWVKRKAYTKMIESYQITPEQKEQIREARGKL